MSDITTQPATRRDSRKKNKRRPIVAFALATLAVGGVGAALTSAAWTDNVFFSASAAAATFDLEGSVDGGKTWSQSDAEGNITLKIDPSAYANLLPKQTRTVKLNVRNNGNVNAALTSTAVWTKDTTFTENPTVAVGDLITTLTPSGTDEFTLTVTTTDAWNATNKGKTGSILVTVSGTATS